MTSVVKPKSAEHYEENIDSYCNDIATRLAKIVSIRQSYDSKNFASLYHHNNYRDWALREIKKHINGIKTARFWILDCLEGLDELTALEMRS